MSDKPEVKHYKGMFRMATKGVNISSCPHLDHHKDFHEKHRGTLIIITDKEQKEGQSVIHVCKQCQGPALEEARKSYDEARFKISVKEEGHWFTKGR